MREAVVKISKGAVKRPELNTLPGGFSRWTEEAFDFYVKNRSLGLGHKIALKLTQNIYDKTKNVGEGAAVALELRNDYLLFVRDVQAKQLENRLRGVIDDKELRLVSLGNNAKLIQDLIDDERLKYMDQDEKKKPNMNNLKWLLKEYREYMAAIRTETTGMSEDEYNRLSDFQATVISIRDSLGGSLRERLQPPKEVREITDVEVEGVA